jgi:hypothetical protein
MSTPTELDAVARKVQQTFYADGLADIFLGGILLLLAAVLLLVSRSIVFLVFAIVLLNPILLKALNDKAKQRWVYPRAGYVQLKPFQDPNRRDTLLGLALILALWLGPIIVLILLYSITGITLWVAWIVPISSGLLLSIGPFLVARKYQIYRYYLFAILPPLIGVIVPWLNLPFSSPYAASVTTFVIQTSIVGLLALLTGIVLLVRFIHRHPIEPTELPEGEHHHALP